LVLDAHTIGEWERLLPQLRGLVGPLEIAILSEKCSITTARGHLDLPIRVGFLGQATRAKGFHNFVRYAEEAKRRCGDQIEFHLIGRLSAELSEFPTGPVKLHTARPQQRGAPPNQMSRERYVALISEMDYVCLPYDGEYYRSGASGVFFDAINFQKPVIASRVPFLEAAFAEFGPLGILCGSDDEMLAAILSLAGRGNMADYGAYQYNMRTCRHEHSPEAVGKRFSTWLRADRRRLYMALTSDSDHGAKAD
jgi:hypothetical protein